MESLRRRVNELEQKVKIAEMNHVQNRRSFSASDAISPVNGKRRRSTGGYIPPEILATLQHGDEQSTVEDTVSAIGLLSNKAMAESRANTGNGPHKLAIIESISAALAVDGRNPSTASLSQHVPLGDEQLVTLTRNLTLSHMQRFLDWSVWLPYINEHRLMEQYETILDTTNEAENTDKTALSRFNTYLAVAIGISISSETGHLSALATRLHAEAIKLLPSILHSQEPLDTLHCMLLLAAFSMFNPCGGSMWHLMGFIMTNCIATGLHKSTIPQERLSSDSIYRAEWMFWSVFLLDRLLASSMGRPFGITDDDISISVPEAPRDDDESGFPAQVRSKLAFSRHLIVHAQLISDICGRDQPSPLFSYSNLCFWREFPPLISTHMPSGFQPQECLEELACRAMILIISRFSSAQTHSPLTLEDSVEIEADTISCCKKLIERLYNQSRDSVTAVSFLDAYNILAAAVAYVCLVQRVPQHTQQGFAQTFEIVSKASVLLTQCSMRFTALNMFQQFLLSLSTKIMEGQGSLQQYLDLIPPEIPFHLRNLVQSCACSGPLAV